MRKQLITDFVQTQLVACRTWSVEAANAWRLAGVLFQHERRNVQRLQFLADCHKTSNPDMWGEYIKWNPANDVPQLVLSG